MTSRVTRPIVSLAVIALLTCLLIGSGSLDSVDTLNRLAVTHWLWAGTPQVPYPGSEGFSVIGRANTAYVTWGIGQSLVMLPADILGQAIVSLLHVHQAADEIRTAVVSFTTFPVVNTIAIVFVFLLLEELGFSERQSWLGALSVLFGTSFSRTRKRTTKIAWSSCALSAAISEMCSGCAGAKLRILVLGVSCLGLSLLMRLPGIADGLAVFFFTVNILMNETAIENRTARLQVFAYAAFFFACYLPFVVIDRFYQWARFASIFTTYTTLWGAQMRSLDPRLPPSFPFDTAFQVGFFGQLFRPDRSIFLFNPLLVATIGLFIWFWSRIDIRLKTYFAANIVLLFADIAFYAKWFEWGGSGSWGPRYAVVPSQALALLAVPLVLRFAPSMKAWPAKIAYATVFAISLIVAATSVLYDFNLEIYQEATFHSTYVVVWQRLVNVFALATGRFAQWGLTPHRSAFEVHRVMTPAFMPWRTLGKFPHTISTALEVCWIAGALLLGILTWYFVARLPRSENADSEASMPLSGLKPGDTGS